jgi:hypothetical protein
MNAPKSLVNNHLHSEGREKGSNYMEGWFFWCLVVAALIHCSQGSVVGQTVFSESFEYPVGPVSSRNGGTGFITPFSGGGTIRKANPSDVMQRTASKFVVVEACGLQQAIQRNCGLRNWENAEMLRLQRPSTQAPCLVLGIPIKFTDWHPISRDRAD